MFQHRLASLCCRVSMIYHSEYLFPKQPSSQGIAKIKNLFLRPYLNYCKDNKENDTAQVFRCLNVIFLFILHFDSVYLTKFMPKRPFFFICYHITNARTYMNQLACHQHLFPTTPLPQAAPYTLLYNTPTSATCRNKDFNP